MRTALGLKAEPWIALFHWGAPLQNMRTAAISAVSKLSVVSKTQLLGRSASAKRSFSGDADSAVRETSAVDWEFAIPLGSNAEKLVDGGDAALCSI
jgi:hypothetical protein